MIDLETIRRLCCDRSIAIVGNSAGLLNCEYGRSIDDCDLVLRMNHGVPKRGSVRAVGRRTDLWAFSFNNMRLQPIELAEFSPKYGLHLPADKRFIHPRMITRSHIDHPDNALRLSQVIGAERPSTGLLVLNFLTSTIECRGPLHVFGFDHFSRGNFHDGGMRRNRSWHDAEREKSYVGTLIVSERIVFHPLLS